MSKTSQFVRAVLGISALAVSAAAQSILSQGEVVMAFGDPIPGVPGATNGGATSLDNASIDLDGNILFRARFVGGGATLNLDDRGYFYGRNKETLQMLLRNGGPEPTGTLGAGVNLQLQQTSGVIGGIGSSPRLSPRGNFILFGSSLVGPGIVATGTTGRNDSALFWGTPGSFQVLAQRGTPTGVGGTVFEGSYSGISNQASALNEAGIATFKSSLLLGDVVGATNNEAWFTGTPGNLSVVIRKGDLIPIGLNTVQVATLGFNCMMNRAGWILHDERLGTSVGTPLPTAADDNIIMMYFPGGANQVVLREGDPANLPSGTGNYGSPTLSQGFGQVGAFGFTCTLTGGTVTPADDSSLWIADAASQTLVAREGMSHPSLAAGEALGQINTSTSFSEYDGGTVAFYSSISGPSVDAFNDTSAWIGKPGDLRLLAREGDPAPGFENNPGFVSATFGNTTNGNSGIVAGSITINDRGFVTFSQVTVTVVDGAGSRNLNCHYSWEPTRGLELLFAAGDVFPTVGGPTVGNTAGGLQFPSGDGAPQSTNNQNDLVRNVTFGTGGAMVRAHVGSNQCTPSVISGLAGGVQTMQLDAGPANAFQVYLVLCTGTGSRPGFAFGGSQIDLNWDPVWSDFAFNSLNTAPWAGTFGLLDATGKATASFTVPSNVFIYAPQELRHLLAVVDLNTLQVPFAGEPCSLLLY